MNEKECSELTCSWRYSIHSLIPVISIAPLQVHYYSKAIPTTALILLTRRNATGNLSEGLVQGPHVAARVEFEPATLRTRGTELTAEPPRPKVPPYCRFFLAGSHPLMHI